MARAACYVESIARFHQDRVACTWQARFGEDGAPHVPVVIPDGCMDLLFADGELLVAGPDTRPAHLGQGAPGLRIAGVRFRPGCAPAVLGVPASALLDLRVPAREVLGRERIDRLLAALHRASPAMAPRVLEEHVRGWIERAPAPDALVARAVALLRAENADVTVASLASDLGVGERRLRRRFDAAVGYGPKLLERVLRLRRFVAAAAPLPRASLAQLAAGAGYADQAHLTRECRALTGLTPGGLAGYPVTAA